MNKSKFDMNKKISDHVKKMIIFNQFSAILYLDSGSKACDQCWWKHRLLLKEEAMVLTFFSVDSIILHMFQ